MTTTNVVNYIIMHTVPNLKIQFENTITVNALALRRVLKTLHVTTTMSLTDYYIIQFVSTLY